MAEAAAPLPGRTPGRAGSLLIAAAIVGFGFLGSRLLGVLRTVAIADAFGSSPDLDAYFVAFRVPDLIFQVLAGATLGSAFIPVFARLYRQDGEDRAWRLASNVLNLVTAATAVLCLLALIFAPLLVPALAPGLGDDIGRHDELTAKAVKLTRLMLLSPLLFAVSGMVMGILNARQRFFLSALAPMVYNLAIIFGAMVLADPWGVEGLAAGVIAGAGLHLLVQLPGLFRERMRYSFSFDWRDAAAREVGRLMAPRVVGLAAGQVNFLVTTFFASQVGAAAISNLTYAWLIAGLPVGLFGIALATAAFPRMADQVAGGDYAAMTETVSRVLRVVMFLTVPAAVGLALLRVPVTTLLLERGEFSAADTAVTASALAWYCLGVIPQAGVEIHSRGYYALGDTRTPVLFAVLAVVLNLVLSAVLFRSFDEDGLAFAVSAASWVEWGLLYAVFNYRTGAGAARDLGGMALAALCSAVMAMVFALAFAPFDTVGRADNVVIALAGTVAGGALYLGLAAFLRVPELAEAVERVRGLFRRGGQDLGPEP
jgi:putative peptidoglycan lipid II flippase